MSIETIPSLIPESSLSSQSAQLLGGDPSDCDSAVWNRDPDGSVSARENLSLGTGPSPGEGKIELGDDSSKEERTVKRPDPQLRSLLESDEVEGR